MEIAYGTLETPIGCLHVAATCLGLAHVGFASMGSGTDWGVGDQLRGDPRWVEQPILQLEEYFEGCLQRFELKLDWRLSQGFYLRVLKELVMLQYGTTMSYGELARAVGSPKAARAVGTAMATNPLALVVPCHRVVRSDGSIGGYAGRPEMKAWLLDHELANR